MSNSIDPHEDKLAILDEAQRFALQTYSSLERVNLYSLPGIEQREELAFLRYSAYCLYGDICKAIEDLENLM